MTISVWVLLLGLSFAFSLSFSLAEVLLVNNPPFTIVFYRLAIASVFMLGLMRMMGKSLYVPKGQLILLFFVGLANNALPFSAIVYGQQYITGGLASIINANTAFFTMILACMVFADERLTTRRFIGIILGICGVAVAIGVSELTALSAENIGQQSVILATLSYAISAVVVRKYLKGVESLVAVTLMLTSSSIWMAGVVLIMEGPPILTPEISGIISILVMALFSTAVAYMLYFALIERAGAGTTMLVTVLTPPFALSVDWLIFRESIGAEQLIGFVLIAVGVWMVARSLPARRG